MNNIVDKFDFNALVGTVITEFEKDAQEFLESETLDIVLSVNELGYGNLPSQLSQMLSMVDARENQFPFSFAIGDYMLVGFLREDTHTKYQIFSRIHLFDDLCELLTGFVEDLEDRGFPSGVFRINIGLRIFVFE
ncbi:hypothetical protein [Paenibacillus dendritiformis]|uniref:hypothetical protein n=1 Tax=Paenibacillus dendritiformis TaxID=130049 RepID=UPI00387E0785